MLVDKQQESGNPLYPLVVVFFLMVSSQQLQGMLNIIPGDHTTAGSLYISTLISSPLFLTDINFLFILLRMLLFFRQIVV